MLTETIEFLEQRKKIEKKAIKSSSPSSSFQYELIIVDDGSRDNTIQIAMDFAKQHHYVDIRILALEKNRGKGGAVTQGMLCARGEYCLMVDADGATKFSDLVKLEEQLKLISKDGYGIAIGSRSHLVSTEAVVKRSFIRNFLMRGFHTLVYTLGIRGIEDTQCGFKLFTRKTAQLIFPNMHVERWIFDIECLMIAQLQKVPIVEVQVNWHEIDGSKVNLITDSVQMARDLFLIRLNYVLGFWKVKKLNVKKNL
ncbi:nucleotide-diphospho-sugar transferase [Cunninghamella echinulata]|nr:nucleotide-diphospho-sugar transferase [Cunninghamella echinulata]